MGEILEQRLDIDVTAVSYPGGRPHMFTNTTKSTAQEVGYSLGFSFYDGVNLPAALDPFDIRRVDVSADQSFQEFRAMSAYRTAFERQA